VNSSEGNLWLAGLTVQNFTARDANITYQLYINNTVGSLVGIAKNIIYQLYINNIVGSLVSMYSRKHPIPALH
jgi:hypothetical protein